MISYRFYKKINDKFIEIRKEEAEKIKTENIYKILNHEREKRTYGDTVLLPKLTILKTEPIGKTNNI